jgi:pyruvate dehydrogenase E2 component (dihydrolipoamide acetyltransferase)
MPLEITMPQLSDTMSEGTVVAWKKKQGDAVKSGEEIADIETDKATMPMEAFEDGVLAWIAAEEGSKVQVGQTIAVLALAGENADEVRKAAQAGGGSAVKPAAAKTEPEPGQDQQTPQQGEMIAGEAGMALGAPGKTPTPAVEPAPAATSAAPAVEESSAGSSDRVVASPLAKRLAEELKVDLRGIRGSGPNGRIIQRDVEEASQRKPSAAAPVAAKGSAKPVAAPRPLAGQKEVVPLSKMRATIAQRLQASKQNLPHFYEVVDIDCEAVSSLRAAMNASLEKQGVRLSLADFIAKALAVALQEHPDLNATFDGKQITRHADVNLGMAVALPDGLIVPVLRGVQQMGLREIRERSADLIDRARQQKLKQEEFSGATFTISNLGNFGIRQFTAIINPPEVAILAIGAAEKRAVVYRDQLSIRTIMTVCLSADHRVVDGAVAAGFLKTFKQLMEEPGLMLV